MQPAPRDLQERSDPLARQALSDPRARLDRPARRDRPVGKGPLEPQGRLAARDRLDPPARQARRVRADRPDLLEPAQTLC
jgi:hypothetical protein